MTEKDRFDSIPEWVQHIKNSICPLKVATIDFRCPYLMHLEDGSIVSIVNVDRRKGEGNCNACNNSCNKVKSVHEVFSKVGKEATFKRDFGDFDYATLYTIKFLLEGTGEAYMFDRGYLKGKGMDTEDPAKVFEESLTYLT